MTDLDKISGVKSFLRRTKTTAELEALSAALYAGGSVEEVLITSLGSEGASSSGVQNFPKWLLQQVVEEILAEGTGRQLGTYANFGAVTSPV